MCEREEIETQQSGECDSSGSLCNNLDENLQRRIVKTVCLGAHIFAFPVPTGGIAAIGYHQEERRSGKPASPSSLCCTRVVFVAPTPAQKNEKNKSIIKKGSPPLPKTVHTNHIQPFMLKTCRNHISFSSPIELFFIEMRMRVQA